jgi:hypothetical protein
MSLNQQKFVISVCMVVFLFLLVSPPVYSRLVINGTEDVFEEPEVGASDVNGNQYQSDSINVLIIKGAGYFIKSYSDTLFLLNNFELSDLGNINFEKLQPVVNRAIHNLTIARNTYKALLSLATVTPYRKSKLEQLESFDYKSFQAKRKLNASIFEDVGNYLIVGDMRGVYAQTLTNVEDLLILLTSIKNNIDTAHMPENSTLWRINQNFSETYLFGQYVAEVFYSLREEPTILNKSDNLKEYKKK